MIDARDIRGGDKVWQHIKQGVPLRVEIGPRDLAAGTVSLSRRDRGPKEREAVPLGEFAARVPAILEDIQQGLFERARAFRDARTEHLDSSAAVIDYFSAGEDDAHRAGFAWAPVADDPAVMEMLDPLKVTVRCIPMENNDAPGTCIVTGKPVTGRSVLARAY